MISNARMYSVSPEAGGLWRSLLSAIAGEAGLPISYIEYAAPAPLDALWQRTDLGAVFMCGLPFSLAEPQPVLIASPVPSPVEFGNEPLYWSEWVVRRDSGFNAVSDTFGRRIAFTVPGSQSGYVAGLSYFMSLVGAGQAPLFAEIIAPTITPLGALSAVIRGDAEIAPIDAYAFRLLQKYRQDLTSEVRVVGHTAPTPIPPLVASSSVASDGSLAALTAAFLEAHENASIQGLMQSLLLRGLRVRKPRPTAYYATASRQRRRFGVRVRWRRSFTPCSLDEPPLE